MSLDDRRIPASVFSPGPEPKRVGFLLADDETIRQWAAGVVDNGHAFEVDDGGPTEAYLAGLYDEAVFGDLPRTKDHHVDLAPFEDAKLKARPQLVRSACLELGAPIAHPVARLAGVDAPMLTVLPVIAPAHRPARWRRALQIHDWTMAYRRIVAVDQRVRDDPKDGRAIADLQRAVEAFFVDGFGPDGTPYERDARAHDGALLAFRRQGFASECLDILRTVTDANDLVLRLRGPLYVFRAYLEAAGVEIVPLRADGSIDVEGRRKSLDDRAVHVFADHYEWVFEGAVAGEVWHGPNGDEALPHVDVYRVPAEAAGWEDADTDLCLTAGMSTRALPGGGRRELACFLPKGATKEQASGVLNALLTAARLPFRDAKAVVESGRALGMGAIVPGSARRVWLFVPLPGAWTKELEQRLAFHPTWLLALAVTPEEAREAAIDLGGWLKARFDDRRVVG